MHRCPRPEKDKIQGQYGSKPLTAGCDRNYSTCVNRFGNRLNFRGEPMVPGTDYLASYPVRGGANVEPAGSASHQVGGGSDDGNGNDMGGS